MYIFNMQCDYYQLNYYFIRAAMKMANIDAVFDFMFTSPKKPNGNSELVIRFACLNNHSVICSLFIF